MSGHGAIRRRGMMVVTSATVLAMATACGTSSSSSSSSKPIIVGTQQSLTSLDPAGTWSTGDWAVIRGVNQNLLTLPPNSSNPSPDAAKKCGWDGGSKLVYTCTLRSGLTFSNGHPLTATDVVYSVNRMVKINDVNGPAALLDTMKTATAPNASTVRFTLKSADATFPLKLTTVAASIVDHKVYPAGKLLPNKKIVGSGPYRMTSLSASQVRLAVNKDYVGPDKVQNSGVTLKIYKSDVESVAALRKKQIDVAAEVGPEDVVKLRAADGKKDSPKLYSAPQATSQSLVFDGSDPVSANIAVRHAVAYLLDRKKITNGLMHNTAEALYSTIPQGLAGHGTAFSDRYGDGGSTAKAAKALSYAHVKTPVKLVLAYPAGRPQAKLNANEIVRQLNSSGLFAVTTKTDEWQAYQQNRAAHKYQVSMNGWLADIPDADNFAGPLLMSKGAFNSVIGDKAIDKTLLPQSRAQVDRSSAAATFAKIDDLAAKDAALIPIYQDQNYMAARPDVLNVDWELDLSSILRYWSFKRGLS